MNKRVLIISQNFVVGGLETRLKGHCQHFTENNIDVFLITGLHCKKKFLPKGIKKTYILDCFHPFSRCIDLFKEINTIHSIIVNNKIDLVLTHPHLSIPSGTLAAKRAGVRCGIVLHGPLNLESNYGLTHQLLLKISLNIADFIEVVSEEMLQLLMPLINHCRYFIEPNKICYATYPAPHLEIKNKRSIAIISRLSIEKYLSITSLLELLKGSNFRISLFGEGPCKSLIKNFVRKKKLNNIKFEGEALSIPAKVKNFFFIAGVDRVVLEGIALNKPTILAGYTGVKGLIDIPLFEKAAFSNYGGRGNIATIERNNFLKKLEACIEQPEPYQLRDKLRQKVSLSESFPNYLKILFNKTLTNTHNLRFLETIIHEISAHSLKRKYRPWLKKDSLFLSITKLFEGKPYVVIKNGPLHSTTREHSSPVILLFYKYLYPIKDFLLFLSYRIYLKLPVTIQDRSRSLLKKWVFTSLQGRNMSSNS